MRYRSALIITQYDFAAILPIAAIGLLIRLYEITLNPLWYDELIAVTLSTLPINDILINLRKIEVHPPPYYLQLRLWMLFGSSDLWITLNSLMWNMLAIFSLFYATRRILGKQVAILASILFAVSPFAIFYAQEVRPYSLLMFLAIWSWYFTHRFFYVSRSPWIDIGFMGSTLMCLYSHGAAFLLLPSIASFGLFYLLEDFNRWRRFLHGMILQGIVVVAYIPWLVRARSVNMRHAMIPSWEDISSTLFTFMFGYGDFSRVSGWISWFSLILLGTVLLITFRRKVIRNISISFVIIPIIFCIAVSYSISPIWLSRTLALIFPFWCLMVAGAFSIVFFDDFMVRRRKHFLGYGIFALFVVLLLTLSIYQQKTFEWIWNIRDAARFVSANVKPNDILYVPDRRFFWAWNWYYSGPGSINPLTTDYSLLTRDQVYVLSGSTIANFTGPQKSYWLIYRPLQDDITEFILLTGNLTQELRMDFNGLIIEKVRFRGG